MTKHQFSYLALGDSYTIGESVPLHESYPYQTVQILRKAGLHFNAPEVVAKTGWASNELAEHILHTKLLEQYDFATLLIGVNNQYRGFPAEEFETDLGFLLKKAKHLTGGHDKRVILLSIPDWGVTPYASNRDGHLITAEIDRFNEVCAKAAAQSKVQYIDITGDSRKAKHDTSLLANDQLHYSGKEHAVWAGKVAGIIKQTILHP
jgi:lysophospholipase L1-like esterase